MEKMYGIKLPRKVSTRTGQLRQPTPEELLQTYAAARGFMTTKGVPDESRAARFILKDYITVRVGVWLELTFV